MHCRKMPCLRKWQMGPVVYDSYYTGKPIWCFGAEFNYFFGHDKGRRSRVFERQILTIVKVQQKEYYD